MKNLIALISIALLAVSCASADKTEKNPFDTITLKETLVEGKTSQTKIAQVFGAPDIRNRRCNKERCLNLK